MVGRAFDLVFGNTVLAIPGSLGTGHGSNHTVLVDQVAGLTFGLAPGNTLAVGSEFAVVGALGGLGGHTAATLEEEAVCLVTDRLAASNTFLSIKVEIGVLALGELVGNTLGAVKVNGSFFLALAVRLDGVHAVISFLARALGAFRGGLQHALAVLELTILIGTCRRFVLHTAFESGFVMSRGRAEGSAGDTLAFALAETRGTEGMATGRLLTAVVLGACGIGGTFAGLRGGIPVADFSIPAHPGGAALASLRSEVVAVVVSILAGGLGRANADSILKFGIISTSRLSIRVAEASLGVERVVLVRAVWNGIRNTQAVVKLARLAGRRSCGNALLELQGPGRIASTDRKLLTDAHSAAGLRAILAHGLVNADTDSALELVVGIFTLGGAPETQTSPSGLEPSLQMGPAS